MSSGANDKRIGSLDGLKAVMMFLIFCWHTPYNPDSPIGEPAADLGARACEVLFVVSGFLVGYRYFDRPIPATFKSSLKYVSGKIAKVWPVHLTAFLIMAVYLAKTDPHDFFSISTAYNAAADLCLLQAWTSDPLSFNGVAWFISALLFCYFMSPILMTVLKRPRHVIAAALAGCIAVRIVLELGSLHGANIFSLDFHFSPVVRCMEFFIGMLMAPAYYEIRKTADSCACGSNADSWKKTAAMTVTELLAAAGYTFLIIEMEGRWIRGYFVLAACVLIFVFALDEGLLSRFLSAKVFAMFAVIQMEFYLLHQVIITALGPKLTAVSQSVFVQSVILFFITVAAAVLFERLLKRTGRY